MSYQKLNQVTQPFTFLIPLCDDAVHDIDTEAKYFIAVDMDSGYFQVVIEEDAQEILALFVLDRKIRCKMMHMGDLGLDPTFIAMMMKLQMEWDTLAKECGLENVASKIIVEDVLLYGNTADRLLSYFRTVLNFLKHHRATLKMKKCKWFQDRCEFVGIDVSAGGIQPTQSKTEYFSKLEQPNS